MFTFNFLSYLVCLSYSFEAGRHCCSGLTGWSCWFLHGGTSHAFHTCHSTGPWFSSIWIGRRSIRWRPTWWRDTCGRWQRLAWLRLAILYQKYSSYSWNEDSVVKSENVFGSVLTILSWRLIFLLFLKYDFPIF